MLESLHIQNYRLFKDFKIDKLGQVNLIAGKNNTGKTALLEAIRIATSIYEASVINNIIYKRGSYISNNPIESFKSIFKHNANFCSIKTNYLDWSETLTIEIKKIKNTKREEVLLDVIDNDGQILGFPKQLLLVSDPTNPIEEVVYIGFDSETNFNGWEKFTQIEEEDLLKILKIIQGNLIDYRIVNNQPFIRISNIETRQSIKYFGDGFQRLFVIAFSLIKVRNKKFKILLIDEFEVGLHHSVQEQLWDIIFKYAKEWNIQVFATTHSRDTVKAFHEVSSKEDYKNMGQYMRLQHSRKTNDIEAVIYTEKSLDTAFDLNLETR